MRGKFLPVKGDVCLRQSMTIPANHAQKVTRDGREIVPAGAIVPANDATAKGILYEDIDVTDGDAFGSIVTSGKVYEDLLPATVEGAAKAAMGGIEFTTSPTVTRPEIF